MHLFGGIGSDRHHAHSAYTAVCRGVRENRLYRQDAAGAITKPQSPSHRSERSRRGRARGPLRDEAPVSALLMRHLVQDGCDGQHERGVLPGGDLDP